MQPIYSKNSLSPSGEKQLASPPVDQIYHAATLAADPALAFDLVLVSVLHHFDAINTEQRQEALVVLIMSRKEEGDLFLSLQDILDVVSTVKNHRSASKETITAITSYQNEADLDRVLAQGIERYNQRRPPVSLKIDWVEVVTHQPKRRDIYISRIIRHFDAINRDANKSAFIPSDHLVDVLIGLLVEVSSTSLDLTIDSIKRHTGATKAMQIALTDYQDCTDFDVLLAQFAARRENGTEATQQIVYINGFKKFEGQWDDISDGYLSWKDWGGLSRTCHALNTEFHQRISKKLSRRGQLVVEKNSDKRAASIKAFQSFNNRIPSQILINKKGILYIQEDLEINCGPNTLIALKKDQLTMEEARQRFQEPMQTLRDQFHYLNNAQFLRLRKYCVDEFLSSEKLAQFPQDEVRNLANFLMFPNVQFYLDQIVLDSNQPVQVLDANSFFKAVSKLQDQNWLGDRIGAVELLRVVQLGIRALSNKDLRELVRRVSITILQILVPGLSARDYRTIGQKILGSGLGQLDRDTLFSEVVLDYIRAQRVSAQEVLALTVAGKNFLRDPRMAPFMSSVVYQTTVSTLLKSTFNQTWLNQHQDLLGTLMHRPKQPLQAVQLFTLHKDGQYLLCETEMANLIQSHWIALDEFLALNEVNQQRLYAHWEIVVPLMDPNRPIGQRWTLKKLVEVIMNEANLTALSDPIIKQLIVDKKMPLEVLFELSDLNKNRLCESYSLKVFFRTADMDISDFFALPPLNQRFLVSYWSVLLNPINDQKLTWDQIKNSTPVDLAVFEDNGLNKYVAHINRK